MVVDVVIVVKWNPRCAVTHRQQYKPDANAPDFITYSLR